MKTRVLKFGGSSFSDLESYVSLANRLKPSENEKLVVVVSAMSGTTGRLQEAGETVNPNLSPQLRDALLGTGELVAACLMQAAFEHVGVSVTHLNGYTLGWKSDSNYQRASIKNRSVTALKDALNQHNVIVVSGGQATDEQGRLTMLGRNSSDLTAVLLAAELGLRECEIYSDVPGVYSTDPYLVDNATCFPNISYDAMIEMSRSGAKVLHYAAVSAAKENNVQIRCRSTSEGFPQGTLIGSASNIRAIIPNAPAWAWTGEQMPEAKKRLEALQIPCFEVMIGLTQAIVTAATDKNAVFSSLAGLNIVYRTDVGVVTHLREKNQECQLARLVVATDQVDALVCRLHGKIEGAKVAGPVLRKTKSKQSGLLIGLTG